MNQLNKISGIIFSLIFTIVIFNYLIFTAFICFKKSDFRNELLKSNITFKEIKQISVQEEDLFKNKNGIEWKEQNKEILLNGNFYEIIKIESNSNKKIITIVEDNKENELFASFFSHHSNNHIFFYNLLKISFGLDELHNFDYNFNQTVSRIFTSSIYIDKFIQSDFLESLIKPPQSS